MPFEFTDYLILAEELAARSDEAAWRSAISRAYYAVLHAGYQVLPPATRATISHRDTHRVTWQLFTASSATVCRQIGHAGFDFSAPESVQTIACSRPLFGAALRVVVHARQTLDRIHRHGYQP